MKYSTENFFNNTNNRLETLNAKLKSVISRYSSLETFVDKFFLILRVLRSEQDYQASLSTLKVPVTYHSITDAALINYMKYLTPYAYRFVAKQTDMKTKVQLANDGNQHYHVAYNDSSIIVTPATCQCMTWQSMKLPCRHILAARSDLGLNMFTEELCDRRWSLDYYKSNLRAFSPIAHQSPSTATIVNFETPSRKLQSQVRCQSDSQLLHNLARVRVVV